MITRDNYEAWFILYLDNELDAEAKAAVEAFALAHPDLGDELNTYMLVSKMRTRSSAGMRFRRFMYMLSVHLTPPGEKMLQLK